MILTAEEFSQEIQSSPATWICGSGASGVAADKFAHTLRTLGRRSFSLRTEEMLHGDFAGIQPEDLLVVVSRSGALRPDPDYRLMFQTLPRTPVLVTERHENEDEYMRLVRLPSSSEADPAGLIPTRSFQKVINFLDNVCLELAEGDGVNYISKFAIGHPGGGIGLLMKSGLDAIPYEKGVMILTHAQLTLRELENEISRSRVGAILLVDGKGKFFDILTDGDLRRYVDSHQLDLDTEIFVESLKAHSSKKPAMANETDSIQEIIGKFKARPDVSILPIISKDHRPLGVVHTKHLIQALRGEDFGI